MSANDKGCNECQFLLLSYRAYPCDGCSRNWLFGGKENSKDEWKSNEAPTDCGPGKIEEPQKPAPASFCIEWFDGELDLCEITIKGIETISTDQFGNWFFFGELVGELRKLIFSVNAEHLVTITRLDTPVA
jgi:hypothetical protein